MIATRQPKRYQAFNRMALSPGEPQGISGAFRTTHWTVVLQAARPDGDGGENAFAQLYVDYWPPLYGYVRRRGHSREEAQDIAQDFFTRLLEKRGLAGLQREGGRFRSFLLRAMVNFLADGWERTHAQKRGSGRKPLSLDAESLSEKRVERATSPCRWAICPAEGKEASTARPAPAEQTTPPAPPPGW